MDEERLRNLEAVIEQRSSVISEHDKQLAEIRVQLAILMTKQEQLIKKLEGFSSGVNRGLWIIGGGFITSIVAWLVGGGLHR